VAAFERCFAEAVGRRHAIAVANGTAALHLICVALDLNPGDEVVVPSLTFAATAAAVVHAGAVPVFADVGSDGRPWVTAESVDVVLSRRTRAIIYVAYGGHPGEVEGVRDVARDRGLVLIEDAAHGPGGAVGGAAVGAFGEAAAFSFFANKNLPLGEGGMVVTDDERLNERVRLLRSHGMTSDTWARHRGEATDYDVLVPGFNYRLDEARAALGMLLLARLSEDNERRAALARRYADAVAGIDGVRAAATEAPGVSSAWHIYPLLLDPSVDRSSFRDVLRAAGVQTSVHYPPLHLTRAFSRYATGPLPATEDYARRTVTVPLFPHLSDEQQENVTEAVRSAVGASRS
jgi:dTDP-4-amino-4,6-dideoxygalactose transaminase